MANRKRDAGREALEKKGWWRSHRWLVLRRLDRVTSVLIGASRAEQLEENVQALNNLTFRRTREVRRVQPGFHCAVLHRDPLSIYMLISP